MLINHQSSTESIPSLAASTSNSDMSSLKELEAKKKKKKSWVGARRFNAAISELCLIDIHQLCRVIKIM